MPKQVDEDGKPVVGPGLYHTLWDTQQVESAESGETEKELREQVQEQKAKMETQQQRVDEQQEEIEALRRELNLLAKLKKVAPESKERHQRPSTPLSVK